jgi:hypothetical protein
MRLDRFTRIATGVKRAIVLIALAGALTAVGIALAAAPAVTAPTITKGPSNPTGQTSASFTYSDSQAGVKLQCGLDGAGYLACGSGPSGGITYPGPLAPGSHTFKVQAISGTKTSSATTYTWTIDTTPPTVTLAFPANKQTYRASSWNGSCSGHPGLCGNAKDAHGVTSVIVSIEQGSGDWWGGSSFNKTSEFFNAATLASPGASTTDWSYPLSLPTNGSYTVHLRATDAIGNTISAGSELVRTFKIDSTPPTPSLTSFPPSQTTATTATFAFTDEESGVTFLCKLDAGSFASCKSPKSYTSLSQGVHTFSVEAKDVSRSNLSAVTSYSWTVGKKTVEEQPFTITGNPSGSLAPGVSQSLPLTISNPNGVAIMVTGLLATPQAGSTKAGCDGPTNLQVTQSNASATNTLVVPANGHVTLPSGTVTAPRVLMKDLPSNQDACKGASFTFSYSGSGHS